MQCISFLRSLPLRFFFFFFFAERSSQRATVPRHTNRNPRPHIHRLLMQKITILLSAKSGEESVLFLRFPTSLSLSTTALLIPFSLRLLQCNVLNCRSPWCFAFLVAFFGSSDAVAMSLALVLFPSLSAPLCASLSAAVALRWHKMWNVKGISVLLSWLRFRSSILVYFVDFWFVIICGLFASVGTH